MNLESTFTKIILLIIIVVTTRVTFFEKEFSFNSIDTIYYFQAVQDYSLANERPHLPGYFIYVKSLELINIVTNNVFISTKIFSIIITSIATCFLFLIFRKYYDDSISFFSALFISFLPTVVFYSSVSENYVIDYFFSILIFYLGNSKEKTLLIPIVLILAAGFRQTSFFLLLPMSAYFIYFNYRNKNIKYYQILISITLSLIICSMWLYPMILNAGGFQGYLQLWSILNPTPDVGMIKNFVGFASNMFYVVLPIMLLLIVIILNKNLKKLRHLKIDKNLSIQLLFWFTPSLLVFLLFHYSKGYILICITSMFFLIGLIIQERLINKTQGYFLLALMVLFYFLITTSPKMIETKFNPQVAKISKIDKFINRLFSSYMPVYDNIRNNNMRSHSLLNLLKTTNDSIPIFADPSVDLGPKLLNTIFPNKQIYSKNLQNNKFYYLTLLSNRNLDENFVLPRNIVFVGNKLFVNNYLKDIVRIIHTEGDYVSYYVQDKNKIFTLYEKYFKI